MHKSPVLIYHMLGVMRKYLNDGKGTLAGLTNISPSSIYGYNNLKDERYKTMVVRISNELESNHYTLNDFVKFFLYSRLAKKPLGSISSQAIREMNIAMSEEQFHDDLKFLKVMLEENGYSNVIELFMEEAERNKKNQTKGSVISVFVKKGLISPITYLFFYKRLTAAKKNIIFMNDNLIVFNREIETISLFYKGVGTCQSRKPV